MCARACVCVCVCVCACVFTWDVHTHTTSPHHATHTHHTHTHTHTDVHTRMYRHAEISGGIRICLRVKTLLHHECSRMLKDTDVCSRMLTYAVSGGIRMYSRVKTLRQREASSSRIEKQPKSGILLRLPPGCSACFKGSKLKHGIPAASVFVLLYQ